MSHLVLSLDALLVGKPALIAPNVLSAIGKRPVAGPVKITWLGLAGDAVADPTVHGGHDKAIHLFPREHYAPWRAAIGEHDLLDAPGAFGENLATRGATEPGLCIGDRFELGTALVEISQGRQPCVKLNHRFGRRDVLKRAVASGMTGAYLRVIREGDAQAGDVLALVERPHPEWTVARAFALLIGGGHKRDRAGVAELAGLRLLAEAWRAKAARLAR